jgi:hypothetical protein
MSDDNDLPRLYDEDEVSKLLKRATELQREEPARVASGGGLSLGELEEIAQEAGIDPRHLRRAALELDTGIMEPSRLVRFLGETPRLAVASSVPGELDGDAFEALIPVIQRAMGEHGQPSLVGRTLTWHAEIVGRRGRTRSLQVTVTSRNGETRIQAEEHLHHLARAIFAGSGGVGGVVGMNIGLTVLHSALAATLLPVGVIGVAYLGARAVFGHVVAARRERLAGVVDQLGREVSATVARRAVEGPGDEGALPPG